MTASDSSSPIRIASGSILYYRMLDVAEEVDLEAVQEILGATRKTTRLSLTRGAEEFVLRAPPLRIPLGQVTVTIKARPLALHLSAKLWDYGVLSFQFEQVIPPGTPFDELRALAAPVIRGFELEGVARQKATELVETFGAGVLRPQQWGGVERYTIYLLEQLEGVREPAELLERVDVPALILGERPEVLSRPMRAEVLRRVFQYERGDMTVLDGRATLLVEPSGEREVAEVLEFARTQMMELRYYDDLLDTHLATLHQDIRQRRRGLLRSRFAPLSDEAASRFIEFSRLVERLENSLKVVGDFYLAMLFRAAAQHFRLGDWKDSITRKLGLLGRTSDLLQNEVNTQRSHLLEIIVVILILFEILAAFFKWHG